MRIDSLAVRGLHGHLNFKMRFGPYLNFLIGINGSGKTSALNVLAWTLFPSFRRLAQLQFNEIKIGYSTGKGKAEKKEVVAKRLQEHIELTISDEQQPLLVPIYEFPPEFFTEGRERQPNPAEIYERFAVEKKDNPVLKTLLRLAGPLYLPLDRRWEQEGRELAAPSSYYAARHFRTARYAATGIIGPVLYLAERYYRERQSELNQLNETLREQIVASTFEVSSFPRGRRVRKPWTLAEVSMMREKIVRGLQQTGIQVPQDTVADYFKSLEKIAGVLEGKAIDAKKPPPVEFLDWVMNIPKVEWIESIIGKIDDYNKKREDSLRRIESFLQSVNSFLCDSNKEIRFDPSGEVVVRMDGKHVIRAGNLSSGETQLLILFTYLYFAFPQEQEFVVMIDEPELSLHPKWQHQYVDSIISANPNVQFILATHSPEVVQRHEERCIEMKLAN